MRHVTLAVALCAAGCSSDSGDGGTNDIDSGAVDATVDARPDSPIDASADPVADAQVDFGNFPDEPDLSALGTDDRPAAVLVPEAYTPEQEWPLAILLHGYTATGFLQSAYLRLPQLVDELGMILITPDGTIDESGRQFWNAFPECCDFWRTGVDDVRFLTSLIDEAETRYRIDPDRIYFFGHSNGGYMSYRMACELGDRVAGIGVLAGAMTTNADLCPNTGPVHVVHAHGTLDDDVEFADAQPSAQFWADRNGCATPSPGASLDLTLDEGNETETLTWDCAEGADVELWTMVDVGHLPNIDERFSREFVSWLLARSR